LFSLVSSNRTFLEPFDPLRPEAFFTTAGQMENLLRAVRDRETDRGYGFGIVERGDGVMVGRVNLSNVVRGAWHNATLGYYVGREWNGRGYATEAVRQVLAFAFETARLHRVQAGAMPRNAPSVRVLEKNGFRREGLAQRYLRINGVWEDHLIFAMTSEEWPPEGQR
jgi:ribosomal-protein-alanine N-acetyltransferase